MYLDIHALHTLPYANVNRDGLGSPKSCVYGGAPRIRVSSQSWKRAARHEVEKDMDSRTVRTRRIAAVLGRHLVEEHGWTEDDARRAGRGIVHAYGLAPDADDDSTKVLLWLPASVVQDLARVALDNREKLVTVPLPALDDKGKIKKLSAKEKDAIQTTVDLAVVGIRETVTEILNSRHPIIELLGRMLAEVPGHTVDGNTQVAHAFTIHESAPDFDYFTAVDDCSTGTGAGHLSTAEFATGTFYRYCNVNVGQLARSLGDVDTAVMLVEAWANTFLSVVPTGKANSTAPTTRPDLVHLAVRDAPLSLASAFEKPVPTSSEGYAGPGRKLLADYTERLHRFIGDPGHWSGYALPHDESWPSLGVHHDALDGLVQAAGNALMDRIRVAAA
ncbi:type I-E CRISPR-associated protein Cas7/Cse4/CasC [Saccharothrix sp. NPDC042600]|uniref:type I-E CRISPR-associated protein Cas7/Cse4/CasC n=1 Tax=Saccharothrix TaxID=2071 RepID=UPI00340045E4|nr:type I-E CRISPR-associated protein Cas7/Cse4/CasC [Saccharothrix mutabilis subsp. capreolus]